MEEKSVPDLGARMIRSRLDRSSKEIDIDMKEADEFYKKCKERDLSWIYSLKMEDFRLNI